MLVLCVIVRLKYTTQKVSFYTMPGLCHSDLAALLLAIIGAVVYCGGGWEGGGTKDLK